MAESTPAAEGGSLSEIRRRLDPCCSYVILEFDSNDATAMMLSRTYGGLSMTEADVVDTRLYREVDSGRMLLVIRLVPGRGEEVRERILASRIPRNTTLHYYGRDVDGQKHTAERL
jgi:hypothetical protein